MNIFIAEQHAHLNNDRSQYKHANHLNSGHNTAYFRRSNFGYEGKRDCKHAASGGKYDHAKGNQWHPTE